MKHPWSVQPRLIKQFQVSPQTFGSTTPGSLTCLCLQSHQLCPITTRPLCLDSSTVGRLPSSSCRHFLVFPQAALIRSCLCERGRERERLTHTSGGNTHNTRRFVFLIKTPQSLISGMKVKRTHTFALSLALSLCVCVRVCIRLYRFQWRFKVVFSFISPYLSSFSFITSSGYCLSIFILLWISGELFSLL